MIGYIAYSVLFYYLALLWQIIMATAILNVVVYVVYLIILVRRGTAP